MANCSCATYNGKNIFVCELFDEIDALAESFGISAMLPGAPGFPETLKVFEQRDTKNQRIGNAKYNEIKEKYRLIVENGFGFDCPRHGR